MESDLVDSCCSDLENYDVKSVVMLQAAFRGHLVRRRMKDLRNTYLGIVESIETKKHLIATWSSPRLSYPKFINCKKISKSAKESEPGHRTIAVNTSICDIDITERKVKSVEIQTTDYHIETTGRMNGPKVDVLISANDLDSDTGPANEVERLEVNVQRSDVNVPKRTIPEKLSSGTGMKLLESLELRIPLDKEEEEEGCGTSSFTEVTSLWASPSEARLRTVSDLDNNDVKNVDSSSILDVRKNLAMELLWVQQAINSRKNYLKLRSQMD